MLSQTIRTRLSVAPSLPLVRARSLLLLLAVLVLPAACVANPANGARRDAGESLRGHYAIVLHPQQFRYQGTLLNALIGQLSGMRIEPAGRDCPAIRMRGIRYASGGPDPQVYVDGSPTSTTCILKQLRTSEVQRVEVYPSGMTDRVGYRSHPSGLILIFLSRK
jgi:hypothetical protein